MDRWEGERSQGTCGDGGSAPKNPFLIIALVSCFPTAALGWGISPRVLGHAKGAQSPPA